MPSTRTGIKWVRPPAKLAQAIEQYGDKVLTALVAVAQRSADLMQNDARNNAPWTDRTSNARSGLFGTAEADFARHVVTIYLSHGALINYGVYLELAHGGKNAILLRTIDSHLPELQSMLDEIFG